MKIGYPCVNNSIVGTCNNTFRLKSYSQERLIETIEKNLNSLSNILQYNLEHNLLFFRIGSSIIPFASHEVCSFDWKKHFKADLSRIGKFIKKHNMRISMHPDQFVVINSPSPHIVQNSINELKYQSEFLDSLSLNLDAKLQIHLGGIYGDKTEAMKRFILNYDQLPQTIKERLVIENDDRLYSAQDCLNVYEKIGIPIIFDNLHFDCLNNDENMMEIFKLTHATWQPKDGIPMIDYSTQEAGARVGKHTSTIDEADFGKFIEITKEFDFDIMLEIKDKEMSALKAHKIMTDIRN